MKIFRVLLTFFHIGVVVLLLCTLLNAYISPQTLSWLNFLSLAFPVLLAMHLMLTLFWIVTWKKRALFFIAISVFFFLPAQAWVNYQPQKKTAGNLKILTLNCKAGQMGTERILDFIKSQNADVVMLQEASFTEGLQDIDGYHRNSSKDLSATYTKHKIVGDEKLISDNVNAYAYATDIEIRGRVYRFINVYLEPFQLDKSMLKPAAGQRENEEKTKFLLRRMMPVFRAHQEQIVAVREAVEQSPYPVFVAGDFNAVPNSYEYYRIANRLQDTFRDAGHGSSTSFHDFKFPLRIDYIFSPKGMKAASYEVDRGVRISDHFPVMATFKTE